MADFQGQWVPHDEDELALVQGLYAVTAEAQQAGIAVDDIVAAAQFVALSIHTVDEEDVPVPEGPVETRREDCPECGEDIESVKPFIGGEVEINPCGCFSEYQRVAGWLDDG